MSKKVKARKLMLVADGTGKDGDDERKQPLTTTPFCSKPPIVHVYTRRSKRPCSSSSLYDSLVARAESGDAVDEDDGDGSEVGKSLKKKKRRRKLGVGELVKLGLDSDVFSSLDRPRLRDCRNYNFGSNSENGKGLKRKKSSSSQSNSEKILSGSANTKRWVRYVSL